MQETFTALCAAADAGDDMAMIAIADLLESSGQIGMATGLRRVMKWGFTLETGEARRESSSDTPPDNCWLVCQPIDICTANYLPGWVYNEPCQSRSAGWLLAAQHIRLDGEAILALAGAVEEVD